MSGRGAGQASRRPGTYALGSVRRRARASVDYRSPAHLPLPTCRVLQRQGWTLTMGQLTLPATAKPGAASADVRSRTVANAVLFHGRTDQSGL